MTVKSLPRLVLACVGVGLVLPLWLHIRTIGVIIPSSQSTSSSHEHYGQSRRLTSLSEFGDPRTVIVKEGEEGLLATDSSLFVVPETILAESKRVLPAQVQSRPPNFDHQGLVVDVLSVGSRTRPEYLTAQINTWASHPHVRNFWGIDEGQDYDPQCDQMDNYTFQSYVQSCRGDMGWKSNRIENFRKKNFGLASGIGIDARNAGWFCAQRRPGHGFGWLMEMYRDSANIPDILMIVDDDTAVNVEMLKRSMQQHSQIEEGLPFVGSSCVFSWRPDFTFGFGGFGTFFNRAAIQRLTRPLHCNDDASQRIEDPSFNELTCAKLQQNTIGELDVFQNGDSVFDIFYKYSALKKFCLHSDWVVGYMLTHYLHELLQQLQPMRCKRDICDSESISCHNQGPEDMDKFVQDRFSFSASSA